MFAKTVLSVSTACGKDKQGWNNENYEWEYDIKRGT